MKRLVLIFFVFSGTAWAGDAGSTSADFLKLGIGPRAAAMGDAQVGLADDVFAAYSNPAGLAQLQTKQAAFVQNDYLQNISEQYVAYAHPTSTFGTFAGSLAYLGTGNFQGYDAVGQPTGDVSAHDLATGLSYARPLFQNLRYGSQLSLGVTAKWIQETLDRTSASAYAVDLGMMYVPGHRWGDWAEGFRAGLVLKNLGTAMTFDQESSSLPRSVTAGLSYSGNIYGEAFTVAADAQQPNDGDRVFGVGLEVTTLNIVILRAGYSTFGDLGSGLRIGGGLRFKVLEVDYAFAGGGDFGSVQRVGILFRFGAPPPNTELLAQHWYEKGIKDSNKGHYADAIVEFNKALEIDPSNPNAYGMMQKNYEKLKATIPQ